MNDRAKPESEGKLPYQAPQVARVSLRPEEAVLGHCKVSGAMGAVSTGGCIKGIPCRAPGS
jgi:hypothetical protein